MNAKLEFFVSVAPVAARSLAGGNRKFFGRQRHGPSHFNPCFLRNVLDLSANAIQIAVILAFKLYSSFVHAKQPFKQKSKRKNKKDLKRNSKPFFQIKFI